MTKNIKKIITAALVTILSIGVLSGCSNNAQNSEVKETIMITHRNGETEVPKNPEKVVVLDYGSLDILDELGVESIAGVPKNGLPTYLSEYKDDKYTDIGGIKEFNFETINEIGPDLIIIEGRQADSYEELSKIAPTIYLGSDGVDYVKGLKSNIDTLSMIFDKVSAADEKTKALEERIKTINENVISNEYDGILTMVADGSMNVYGKGSRFNIIYNELGFKCTDENIEVSKHGQNVSNEYIAEKNPGYLFVIDKGVITGSETSNAKEIIENELVKTTDTYKNNKIIYLNAEAWYVGGAGIKSANIMLDDIEKAL